MMLALTSCEHLTDEEFVEAFESCSLPNEAFHHRDHLRLAWIYLRESDLGPAADRFARNLLRFATHHGGAKKYHHTMTFAWMHLIAAAMRESPDASFGELLAAHPELSNRQALMTYYSGGLLAAEFARTGWAEPDLQPLPRLCNAGKTLSLRRGPGILARQNDPSPCRCASSPKSTAPRTASPCTWRGGLHSG